MCNNLYYWVTVRISQSYWHLKHVEGKHWHVHGGKGWCNWASGPWDGCRRVEAVGGEHSLSVLRSGDARLSVLVRLRSDIFSVIAGHYCIVLSFFFSLSFSRIYF